MRWLLNIFSKLYLIKFKLFFVVFTVIFTTTITKSCLAAGFSIANTNQKRYQTSDISESSWTLPTPIMSDKKLIISDIFRTCSTFRPLADSCLTYYWDMFFFSSLAWESLWIFVGNIKRKKQLGKTLFYVVSTSVLEQKKTLTLIFWNSSKMNFPSLSFSLKLLKTSINTHKKKTTIEI